MCVCADVKLRLENDRLTKELDRLRRLFEYSEDGGAVGGCGEPQLSDTNSLDAHSSDGGSSSNRIGCLEVELKMARRQIARTCTMGPRPKLQVYRCVFVRFRA